MVDFFFRGIVVGISYKRKSSFDWWAHPNFYSAGGVQQSKFDFLLLIFPFFFFSIL